jgi:hypothetical protein
MPMHDGGRLMTSLPIGYTPTTRGLIDLNRQRQRLLDAYTETTESEADHVGFS